MSQYAVPCVVYRGGTSRGLFFLEKDLPGDWESRKQIFLAGIDAFNPSQINGLGSGTSHTSKVVIMKIGTSRKLFNYNAPEIEVIGMGVSVSGRGTMV